MSRHFDFIPPSRSNAYTNFFQAYASYTRSCQTGYSKYFNGYLSPYTSVNIMGIVTFTADKLLKALQDYYSISELDSEKDNQQENKAVKEGNAQQKVVKRKRSVEVVKSPKTPQAKRLKIQPSSGLKTKSVTAQLKTASPSVRHTPKQPEKATAATPRPQQTKHVRRGTYEKKNSPKKSGGKVTTSRKKSSRSRSRDNGKHKRNSTYDRVSEPEIANGGVESAGKIDSKKHQRRSTFTKQEEQAGQQHNAVVEQTKPQDAKRESKGEGGRRRNSKGKSAETSPGVQSMINAMNEEMTQAEMKESLLKELNKRAKDKVPVESSEVYESSQIPRYTGLGAHKAKKPNTPSGKFQSAHSKQFEKMESIDQWMDRKNQRSEALGASMKKLHMLTQQMRGAVESAKKYQTPPSLLKKSHGHMVAGKSKLSLFQSPSAKPFVPTVTSVSKADFKFLKSPRPAPLSATRKSPRLSGAGRENRPSNTSNLQPPKPKTGGTPFRFKGNTSLMNKSHNSTLNSSASARPKFDLHASLQRPVTWKTHKGKVQPLGTYNSTNNRVKDENRQRVQSIRSDKRLDMQMKRRGFVP